MPIDHNYLTSIGREWLSQIRYIPDKKRGCAEANALAKRINDMLKADNASFIRVSVSRYQFYELLVSVDGTAYKYDAFISNFAGDKTVTSWILDFMQGNRAIGDFSGHTLTPKKQTMARAFVAIVCIAEYGRNYTNSTEVLIDYLTDILAGTDTWSNLKSRYSPALTYAQDIATDYEPSSDSDDIDDIDFLA